jgi:hypothetical protein
MHLVGLQSKTYPSPNAQKEEVPFESELVGLVLSFGFTKFYSNINPVSATF